ncbi:MAG TPA: MFS transporter [Dehalococcoidales bacterium]|nr:MFS transporter [Dehalococcoidales bacterium]
MKRIFAPLAFSMFTSNLGMGIVAPLLSIYARDMGASGVWIGLVMASYAIANIVSTPLFGRLSDRKGRKLFLMAGLLAYAFISLGYIFAPNLPLLCFMRLLHGAAGGMVLPIASAYIGDVSPKGQEGKWMGYASAAFYSGFGVGPLLGGVMSQYGGMNFAFAFMAGLNFLAMLIIYFFLPETEARQSRIPTQRTSIKEMLKSKIVSGLFSYQIAAAVSQGSYITFLPIIGMAKGLSLTMVGIIISATMSLMSLMGTVAGRVADRFNKRWLIVGGSCLIITALFLIPHSDLFWVILALALLLALGAGTANPAIAALSVTEGRKFGMGSTMGVVNMGLSIGFAVGPIIAGRVVDLGETSFAFYFGAGMLCLGVIVFFWLTSRQSSTGKSSSNSSGF